MKQKKNANHPASPTPLEKQLLSKRFPTYANRILPDYSKRTVADASQPNIKENRNISVQT